MGHIAFAHDVTFVHAFVTFITRVQQMLKFTFKFTLSFTKAFHLEVITWVPFILGS